MTKKSKNRALSLFFGLGLMLASAIPARAEEKFDNQVVQFQEDTIVEFEFVESRGAYQSTFGVVNLNTGEKTPLVQEVKPADDNQATSTRQRDFIGTPGNAVPQPFNEFLFKANTPYSFYLESTYQGRTVGIVYSTNSVNQAGNQLARFDQNLEGLENQRGITIRWNDTGSALVNPDKDDIDFNDFTVIAGGFKGCPCNPEPSYPRIVAPPEQPIVPPEQPTVPEAPKPAVRQPKKPVPRAPRARW